MRLFHYSSAYLEKINDEEQVGHHIERGDKPNGLWFSAGDGDDGWLAWCEAESFRPQALTHVTEIILRPDANILRLSGAVELDLFTAKHRCIPEYAKAGPESLRRLYGPGHAIDWKTVASQYDGIIIAPYCYQRRLHDGTHWYYSWDCASGCIWRARAVQTLIPVKQLAHVKQ